MCVLSHGLDFSAREERSTICQGLEPKSSGYGHDESCRDKFRHAPLTGPWLPFACSLVGRVHSHCRLTLSTDHYTRPTNTVIETGFPALPFRHVNISNARNFTTHFDNSTILNTKSISGLRKTKKPVANSFLPSFLAGAISSLLHQQCPASVEPGPDDICFWRRISAQLNSIYFHSWFYIHLQTLSESNLSVCKASNSQRACHGRNHYG